MKGTGALTARQEKDLTWYFRHADADTSGVRSNLQAALDRRRDGTPRATSRRSRADLSEEQLAIVKRAREISAVLERVNHENARVLERFYGPGKWSELAAWGKWAPIIMYTAGAQEFARNMLQHLTGKAPVMKAMGWDQLAGDAHAVLIAALWNNSARGAIDRKADGTWIFPSKRRQAEHKARLSRDFRQAEDLLRAAETAYRSAYDQTRPEKPRPQRLPYQKTVTIREAAKIRGVSEATIKRWLDDGTLTPRMAGKQRRVLLTSDIPFPPNVGVETRGRKRVLTIAGE